MSNTPQNLTYLQYTGQFPITAPDLAVSGSSTNPSAGGIVDIDDLATETISELQNLQQDLTNRLTEQPGSNLDFDLTSIVNTNYEAFSIGGQPLHPFVTVTENAKPNTRGVGIMSYLSAPTDKLQGLRGRIDNEFEQDPRVVASATTLQLQPDGSYVISTQLETVAGVLGLAWSWGQWGVAPLPITA